MLQSIAKKTVSANVQSRAFATFPTFHHRSKAYADQIDQVDLKKAPSVVYSTLIRKAALLGLNDKVSQLLEAANKAGKLNADVFIAFASVYPEDDAVQLLGRASEFGVYFEESDIQYVERYMKDETLGIERENLDAISSVLINIGTSEEAVKAINQVKQVARSVDEADAKSGNGNVDQIVKAIDEALASTQFSEKEQASVARAYVVGELKEDLTPSLYEKLGSQGDELFKVSLHQYNVLETQSKFFL